MTLLNTRFTFSSCATSPEKMRWHHHYIYSYPMTQKSVTHWTTCEHENLYIRRITDLLYPGWGITKSYILSLWEYITFCFIVEYSIVEYITFSTLTPFIRVPRDKIINLLAGHWRRNVTKWWGQLNFESTFRAYHRSEDIWYENIWYPDKLWAYLPSLSQFWRYLKIGSKFSWPHHFVTFLRQCRRKKNQLTLAPLGSG